MKIWHGYGSEHSMNLVMIGHFKDSESSKKAHRLIKELTDGLRDMIDVGTQGEKFDDDVTRLLREKECYSLGPSELEQFLYDFSCNIKKEEIVLTTDEFEVSAFFKIMINNGAKVEIFSSHDYPK